MGLWQRLFLLIIGIEILARDTSNIEFRLIYILKNDIFVFMSPTNNNSLSSILSVTCVSIYPHYRVFDTIQSYKSPVKNSSKNWPWIPRIELTLSLKSPKNLARRGEFNTNWVLTTTIDIHKNEIYFVFFFTTCIIDNMLIRSILNYVLARIFDNTITISKDSACRQESEILWAWVLTISLDMGCRRLL